MKLQELRFYPKVGGSTIRNVYWTRQESGDRLKREGNQKRDKVNGKEEEKP